MEPARRRIFYLCPDDRKPVGGVKHIYHHVEVLDRAGFDARVAHHERGLKHDWFENAAPSTCIYDITLSPEDWVVVPEVVGPDIHRMWEPARLVIFNLNAYYTFLGYPGDESKPDPPYLSERVKAVITCSRDIKEYLDYTFAIKTHHVITGVPGIFSFQAGKHKKIAYMPRKNPDDVTQVINIRRWEPEAFRRSERHEDRGLHRGRLPRAGRKGIHVRGVFLGEAG